MMRAGKYYVGDLCYVMQESWDEVCDLLFTEDRRVLNGEFNLKDGRRFAVYTTKYGDGTYYDGEGGRYFVDAGVIGCILYDDIDPNERNDVDGGNVIVFKEDFNTSSDGENITIGDVTILTGDYDEDPEEEEEYEEELI
jgi:hypothetical protein